MQNMQKQNENISAGSEQQNAQLKQLQEKLSQMQQQQQLKKEQQKKNQQELLTFSNSMHECVQEVKQQLLQIRDQVKQNSENVSQKIVQAKNDAKNLGKMHEESTVSEIGKCFQLLEENNENINNNKNIIPNNNNRNITLRELSLNNLPTDLKKKFNPLSLQFSIKLNKFINQHQTLSTQNEKLLFQMDDINQKLQGLIVSV
eukprot:TRINITY_DN98143_c0_g1_i1.p1 TRINITY_DN98143_c0_g1~~TRINITY_DN98143_c0_g1_i1.p1  ORF type:complete len:202 (-),score=26.95 TRINITY_DN98143_c0_g1_i1:34-639(-)